MLRKISLFALLLVALLLMLSAAQGQDRTPVPVVSVSSDFTVTWTRSIDAIGYAMRYRHNAGEWQINQLLVKGAITHNFADMPPGLYEVQVRDWKVVNGDAVNGVWSNTVAFTIPDPNAPAPQPLPAPQNLRVEGYTILWDAVENAVNYDVILKTLSGSIPIANVTAATHDIPDPVEGKFYVVLVQSKGDGVTYEKYGGITDAFQFFAYPPPTPIPTATPLPTSTPVPTATTPPNTVPQATATTRPTDNRNTNTNNRNNRDNNRQSREEWEAEQRRLQAEREKRERQAREWREQQERERQEAERKRQEEERKRQEEERKRQEEERRRCTTSRSTQSRSYPHSVGGRCTLWHESRTVTTTVCGDGRRSTSAGNWSVTGSSSC